MARPSLPRGGKLVCFAILVAVLLAGAGRAAAVDITGCAVLNSANGFYNLTQDVLNSANTTCISVGADNVTLDCGGKAIDGLGGSNTHGIFVSAVKNFTARNCVVSDWDHVIFLNNVSGSAVYGGNLTGNNGIEMYNSWRNNISGNVVGALSYGIYMSNSSFNSLYGNRIGNGTVGIAFFSVSSNNTVSGGQVRNPSSFAFYIYQSYDNFFRDVYVDCTGTNVYHFSSSQTNFLNVTLDESKISIDAGRVYFKWYLDARAVAQDGSPLSGANVTIRDSAGNSLYSGLTDSSGYAQRQNLTEFFQNFTGKYYFYDYVINASVLGYLSNQTSVNVTESKTVLITTPLPPPSVEVKTYDNGLVESDKFTPGRTARIRAIVTFSLGRALINYSTITIRNSAGSPVVTSERMENISEIANGYIYEYNYTIPSGAQGLWSVEVVPYVASSPMGFASKKIAVVSLTLQVKLVLNSTSDSVYVPYSGGIEIPFSSIATQSYPGPAHYYLASYQSGVLKALVSSDGSPLSIFTEKGSAEYGMGIEQRFSNSMVLLVFSRGDWRTIENRMTLVENGEFTGYPEPTFGFGLGNRFPLKVALQYGYVDLNKSSVIYRGLNNLIIEKISSNGNRVVLQIGRG
jgi:parallel beta-helix repeat protein